MKILVCSTALLIIPVAVAGQSRFPQSPDIQVPALDAQVVTPAYASAVDGDATLERDGRSQPLTMNLPIIPGDRLRTTTGRIEIVYADATTLDIDQQSIVDLQGLALVRVHAGCVILTVAGVENPSAAARFQVDTPAASVHTTGPGEYRVTVRSPAYAASSFSPIESRPGDTELAVVRGSATLETDQGTMPLSAGERSVARDGEAPAYPRTFNSARLDAFDRWAAARRDERTSGASAEHLPGDLRGYGGTFDRYGAWEYDEPFGYVWYPTVADDWQPYYNGYWMPYATYGWTWVGLDSWAWPTHHYGRWGYKHARWFWIPGRSWGPAWVSWASAGSYVSWCPLGVDGRPVSAFPAGGAPRSAGWTIVPRHTFGSSERVAGIAVPRHLIPATAAFVENRQAPIAIPRTQPSADASRQPTRDDRRSAVGRRRTIDVAEPVRERRQPAPGATPYAVPRSSVPSVDPARRDAGTSGRDPARVSPVRPAQAPQPPAASSQPPSAGSPPRAEPREGTHTPAAGTPPARTPHGAAQESHPTPAAPGAAAPASRGTSPAGAGTPAGGAAPRGGNGTASPSHGRGGSSSSSSGAARKQ